MARYKPNEDKLADTRDRMDAGIVICERCLGAGKVTYRDLVLLRWARRECKECNGKGEIKNELEILEDI